MLHRLLLAMLLALALVPAHSLACIPDPDGDGYCNTFPKDCDNSSTGGSINPNAQEDLVDNNLVDEDCDGHHALNRRLLNTSFAPLTWLATGVVSRTCPTTR